MMILNIEVLFFHAAEDSNEELEDGVFALLSEKEAGECAYNVYI